MKAQELRIGNYIYKDGEEIIVSSYTFYNVERDDESYEPIPLTEEWLVKFGFEKMWYGFELGLIEIDFNGDRFMPSINCNEYTFGVELQYVHQLQNLYSVLTGKELVLQNA